MSQWSVNIDGCIQTYKIIVYILTVESLLYKYRHLWEERHSVHIVGDCSHSEFFLSLRKMYERKLHPQFYL